MTRRHSVPQTVVAAYLAGEGVAELARRHKVHGRVVHRTLLAAGVELRGIAEAAVLRRGVPSKQCGVERPHTQKRLPMEQVQAYRDGLSMKQLALRCGVSRPTAARILQRLGVTVRTGSQQAFIDAAKSDPAAKMARLRAAHAAVRGTKRPQDVLDRTARSRQMQAKMTANESIWADRLLARGIATVPQYAVDRFNIDLAVPDVRIAIEVQCSWHYTGKHRKNDAAKKALLESYGWVLLTVFSDRKTTTHEDAIVHAVMERREWFSAIIQAAASISSEGATVARAQ